MIDIQPVVHSKDQSNSQRDFLIEMVLRENQEIVDVNYGAMVDKC
jgi:hypothetical protein